MWSIVGQVVVVVGSVFAVIALACGVAVEMRWGDR